MNYEMINISSNFIFLRCLAILNNLTELLYIFTNKPSNELAQELNNIHITSHLKITTLDIKVLYVNLTIQNIISITNFSLNKNINEIAVITNTNLKPHKSNFKSKLFSI